MKKLKKLERALEPAAAFLKPASKCPGLDVRSARQAASYENRKANLKAMGVAEKVRKIRIFGISCTPLIMILGALGLSCARGMIFFVILVSGQLLLGRTNALTKKSFLEMHGNVPRRQERLNQFWVLGKEERRLENRDNWVWSVWFLFSV